MQQSCPIHFSARSVCKASLEDCHLLTPYSLSHIFDVHHRFQNSFWNSLASKLLILQAQACSNVITENCFFPCHAPGDPFTFAILKSFTWTRFCHPGNSISIAPFPFKKLGALIRILSSIPCCHRKRRVSRPSSFSHFIVPSYLSIIFYLFMSSIISRLYMTVSKFIVRLDDLYVIYKPFHSRLYGSRKKIHPILSLLCNWNTHGHSSASRRHSNHHLAH